MHLLRRRGRVALVALGAAAVLITVAYAFDMATHAGEVHELGRQPGRPDGEDPVHRHVEVGIAPEDAHDLDLAGSSSSASNAPNRASASRQPGSASGTPDIVHVSGATASGNTSPTSPRV